MFTVAKLSLDSLKVLVTRPQYQAHSLCEMVTNAGGEAIAFPTIDIVPIAVKASANTLLNQHDIIIFVSRNSVANFGYELRALLAKNVTVVAIGGRTAKFLLAQGFANVLQPATPAGSESVLTMPALQDVKGKNVLIVRGQDGRELLAETLTERGAKTHYLEVYQRAIPIPTPANIKQALLAECIIISSVNSLVNLSRLIGEKNVLNKQLIVVSYRIKQYAIEQGFKHIEVADDASDGAVMRQIMKVGQNNGRK